MIKRRALANSAVRPMKLPQVVIVGAGFGGITAAKALARHPSRSRIVDRHNFHTFSPLLYQVATAGLAPDDIAPNLRGIVQRDPNVDARMADRARRRPRSPRGARRPWPLDPLRLPRFSRPAR